MASMTDLQVLTIALTLLSVLAGTFFNNVRISDLSARLGDVKDALRAEFRADIGELRHEMRTQLGSMDRKLDEILRIVGDHETRITNIEGRNKA